LNERIFVEPNPTQFHRLIAGPADMTDEMKRALRDLLSRLQRDYFPGFDIQSQQERQLLSKVFQNWTSETLHDMPDHKSANAYLYDTHIHVGVLKRNLPTPTKTKKKKLPRAQRHLSQDVDNNGAEQTNELRMAGAAIYMCICPVNDDNAVTATWTVKTCDATGRHISVDDEEKYFEFRIDAKQRHHGMVSTYE
jgi:hypothetical protein